LRVDQFVNIHIFMDMLVLLRREAEVIRVDIVLVSVQLRE